MEIKYKEIETINEFIDAIRLRVDVFIKEQGSKPGWEPDEEDKVSRQFIAIVDNQVVSTARARTVNDNEIKIERMATIKGYRGKDIGRKLLKFMIKKIKEYNPKRIWTRSQVQAQLFYEKCGFKPISKPFDEYGILHLDMEYQQ